jgi:hypothetical protein
MQKWEYAFVWIHEGKVTRGPNHGRLAPLNIGDYAHDKTTMHEVLARLGDAGWELVGVGWDFSAQSNQLFFKRPKQS